MNKVLIFVWMIFTFISCNSQPILTEQIAANKVCDCYNEQYDNNKDKNLSPCFEKLINDTNNQRLISHIYPDLSKDSALSEFARVTFLILVRECDFFYRECDSMYANFYPLDTSIANNDSILMYDKLILQTENLNDIKKYRHKRLAHLLMFRDFQRAQIDIDSLKKLNELGAFLAGAWSNYKQAKCKESLSDIDKAISFETNPYIEVFREIIIKNCK